MSRQRIDADSVKAAAAGRWLEILASPSIGVPADVLDGRKHPCPRCGGRDRFRLWNDDGGLRCSHCFADANGDGLSAVQWFCGCDFPSAVERVAEILGLSPAANGKKKNSRKKKEIPSAEKEISSPPAKRPLAVDRIEWLPDCEKAETFMRIWCSRKPPITIEALRLVRARVGIYRGQFAVVALPVWPGKPLAGEPCGWVMYAFGGGCLPTWAAGGEDPEWVKVLTLQGSARGVIGATFNGIDPAAAEGVES